MILGEINPECNQADLVQIAPFGADLDWYRGYISAIYDGWFSVTVYHRENDTLKGLTYSIPDKSLDRCGLLW